MSVARDSSGETAGNSGGNLDRWLAGFRGEAARRRASFNEAHERSVRLGRGVEPLAAPSPRIRARAGHRGRAGGARSGRTARHRSRGRGAPARGA